MSDGRKDKSPVMGWWGIFLLFLFLFFLFFLGLLLSIGVHHVIGYLFYVGCVILFGAKAGVAGLTIWLLLWFIGPPFCTCHTGSVKNIDHIKLNP